VAAKSGAARRVESVITRYRQRVVDDEKETWFRPGQQVEWVGPEPLESETGTVAVGDVGTVVTDDRPASAGVMVVFNGVGTFVCESGEICPPQ